VTPALKSTTAHFGLTTTEVSLGGLIEDYLEQVQAILGEISRDQIEAVGELLYQAYEHHKQVFVVGNGGSAATASHMSCDLGKNTVSERQRRLRIQSLTDNTPLLSALANDLGYDHIFSEQLDNLIRPGDLLVAISASGNSPNVLNAMRFARKCRATVVALLGFSGGRAMGLADEYVHVPSDDYGDVEDAHMILNHVLTNYFRMRIAGAGLRRAEL
jgi:Phosphoheptose isomerase